MMIVLLLEVLVGALVIALIATIWLY